MEEELIDESTKMAHLLETHPDTSYNGDLYASSLGLRCSKEIFPEHYEKEINMIESEIKDTASSLNSYNAVSESMDKEIGHMLEEAKKIGSEEIHEYQQQKYIEDTAQVVGGLIGQVLGGIAAELGEKYLERT